MIFTAAFWKGAGERAIKTFLQAFVGALVAATGGMASGVIDLHSVAGILTSALVVAVVATLGSLSTSLGNSSFTAGAEQMVPDEDSIDEPAGDGLED